MVQTRAQERAGGANASAKASSTPSTKKRAPAKKRQHEEAAPETKEESKPSSAKKSKKDVKDDVEKSAEPEKPTPKKAKKGAGKKDSAKLESAPKKAGDPKIQQLLEKYGSLPLANSGLKDPSSPTAETLLALVFNAMLSSTRISHDLAAKSIQCLIDAGYADLSKLEESSWEKRTEVLTEGGYTHYRERTATQLGDLATFVKNKYKGDLNNLLKEADGKTEALRKKLGEIKGIGNVGLDIFCDTTQGVWPSLAPFLDPRSKKYAESIGIGGSVEELWEAVGKDAKEMCRLASALTNARLAK